MLISVHDHKFYKVKYDQVTQLQNKIGERLANLFAKKNHDNLIKNGICSFWGEDGRLLHHWEELQDFMIFAKEHLACYAASVGIDKQNLQIHSMWANKYPTNAYIKPHRHNRFGDSSITCNFYLIKPENSGNIVLELPSFDSQGKRKIDKYELQTYEGEMIIFPSTILHWTTPNQSSQDKITIGFDVYYGNNPNVHNFYEQSASR